jgi:hypothetical protein
MNTQTIKTTIEIDANLLKLAKFKAIQEQSSLKTIVNQALAHSLSTTTVPEENPAIGGHHLGGINTKLSRNDIYDEY